MCPAGVVVARLTCITCNEKVTSSILVWGTFNFSQILIQLDYVASEVPSSPSI